MLKAHFEAIKEDTVEYWLYSSSLNENSSEFIRHVYTILPELTKDYIWHKDAFCINAPVAKNEELPQHLYGMTFHGDNIEDEWFIVYLLMELSKSQIEIIAQVKDSDGEFLLIEAADHLPGWLTPETADNRIYIVNGDIHIIPDTLIKINEAVNVTKALQYVRSHPHQTRANEDVQNAIKQRISKYPKGIKENFHKAFARIPSKIATVLIMEPSLIAPIVNAYCDRDSIESNICKTIELVDCVDTSVTFTKCLYAMLTHSNVLHKASWRLPPKSSLDYKKSILGVKLTCGFEILISKASQETFHSKEWSIYLDSLNKNGYFRGNIDGSKHYTELLESAKQYFINNVCSNVNAYIGNHIKEMITSPTYHNIAENLTLHINSEEDNDCWLNIDPEELNSFMSKHYGKPKAFSKTDVITPQTITNQLSSFLKQTSDLEGIELDKEIETNSNQVLKNHSIPPQSNENLIEFDYQQFSNCIKNILDTLVPEGNISDNYGSDVDYSSDCSSHDKSDESESALHYQKVMDKELSQSTLAESFISDGNSVDVTNNVYKNFMNSMKEEKGGPGPSSNLLSNIGFKKKCFASLDSDDDDFETIS